MAFKQQNHEEKRLIFIQQEKIMVTRRPQQIFDSKLEAFLDHGFLNTKYLTSKFPEPILRRPVNLELGKIKSVTLLPVT